MADVLNISREQEALKAFDRLEKRRLNGKFDFTIIVGNQKIYADQNILASGSDYFDAMLSHDTIERQNGKVEMKGVDFESVKICIDHIYRREISVPVEKYQDVMPVASMMQLQVLCDAMERKMCEKLTTKTFFTIRDAAVLFEKQVLIDKCLHFALENFESIATEEKFNTLEKSFIAELMKSESNEVDEERKLEVILEWVRFDENRNSHLLELLKCIDYSQISSNVGQFYIKNEPLINTNNKCLVFFSLAIVESMASPAGTLRKHVSASKNKVLIFGKTPQKFILFGPTDNTLKELSWERFDVRHFSVVNLDGYLYVLGYDRSVCRLKHDEVGATWEQMANMNKYHGHCPPATVIGRHIFVLGGHHDCISASVERYNPHENTWVNLYDQPQATRYAEIVTLGGYIYSLGGFVINNYTNEVRRLNIMTSHWKELSPMNEAKGYVSATLCKGMIYVAGGCVHDHVKSLERYDPSSDVWTVLSQMNIARSWFNLHAVGQFLYAVGGYFCSPGSIEVYNIKNDSWEVLRQEKQDDPLAIAYSVII